MLDRAAEFFFFGFAPLMAGILIAPDFMSRGRNGAQSRAADQPGKQPSAVIVPFPRVEGRPRSTDEPSPGGGETPLIP